MIGLFNKRKECVVRTNDPSFNAYPPKAFFDYLNSQNIKFGTAGYEEFWHYILYGVNGTQYKHIKDILKNTDWVVSYK